MLTTTSTTSTINTITSRSRNRRNSHSNIISASRNISNSLLRTITPPKLNVPISTTIRTSKVLFQQVSLRVIRQTPASTSYPNLSVADILDRYQDAHKDFLVSILNAKAKEDERKAEEERYKTEQIRLQSKQLELELALEKQRGSPPAGMTAYPPYPNATPSSAAATEASHQQPYSRQNHHEHSIHPTQDAGDQSSSKHTQGRHSNTHHSYQEQSQMLPSPQGRPPSLKINTAFRQSYPKQHQQPHSASAQRVSPQYAGSLLPLPQPGPSSSKGSGRHYNLPTHSSSAQSSPVANIDYQSHIPPPLTPKDDHVSPTSALSPAPGQTLKRKSIHHDAVMDAVRAKVLRNVGQSQQQREQQREQLHKKTSMDQVTSRRKPQPQSSSPDRSKRTADTSNGSSTTSTGAGPKSKYGYSTSGTTSPSRQYGSEGRSDGPLLASLPVTGSPTSPSTSASANAGSGRSRSSTPPSAGAASDIAEPTKPLRKENQNGYRRASIREDSRMDISTSADDENMSSPKYEMERTRADRSSEIGGN
ncbi:hypothetical protein BGZ58_008883 [Dissophora ornata]|nr:hypothetical protein BGZ58_008883 [Dissophora ornata]